MVINTKEFSARVKLGISIFTLFIMASIVLMLLFKLFPQYNKYISLFLIGVLIVVLIFSFLKNYHYIYFNSDGFKIILRYSSLILFFEENSSIEIPRHDFVKAEIVNKFGGFRKELIIYVQTPQGVAKFKPVSLSTLSKNEIKNLIESLNNISQ